MQNGAPVKAHDVAPEGVYRPMVPLPYAGETQNGYEYAAAIQMIQSGWVEEGMAAAAAIRARARRTTSRAARTRTAATASAATTAPARYAGRTSAATFSVCAPS